MSQTATLISKDEVNTALLQGIFRQAFMDPHLDADGDLYVTAEGYNMYLQVDARGAMRVYILFRTNPQTTHQQVIELSNRINETLWFIRACSHPALPTALLLDHWIDTSAGVTALEVVDEVRRFRSVLTDVPKLDTGSILT